MCQVFCAARAAVADAWKMDESAVLAVREGGASVDRSTQGPWGPTMDSSMVENSSWQKL